MIDRPLAAFVAFCVALVAFTATWWAGSRLVDIAPHTHRADLVYETAYHGGAPLGVVAVMVGLALVASEWRGRR